MVTSGLLISSFTLKKRFKRSEEKIGLNPYKFKNFKSDFDILTHLKNFMIAHQEIRDDVKKKKLFGIDIETIKELDGINYRAITCIIKCGSYGIEAEITNKDTKNVVYTRRENEADTKKFRCLFYIPKNVENNVTVKGIVVFQMIGNFGVKSITTEYLKNYFSQIEITYESNMISISNYFQRIIRDDKLSKITFVKNNISPDDSDNIFVNKGKEERSYIMPQLKNNIFDTILGLIETRSNGISSIIEIEDKEYDDIKMAFKVGDSTKTISLQNISQFSIVEDVPDEIYRIAIINPEIFIGYIIETIEPYCDNMIIHHNLEE